MSKEYIGDGVYADDSEGVLVLTTEDGISVHDRIVIEREVLKALLRYVDRSFPERGN